MKSIRGLFLLMLLAAEVGGGSTAWLYPTSSALAQSQPDPIPPGPTPFEYRRVILSDRVEYTDRRPKFRREFDLFSLDGWELFLVNEIPRTPDQIVTYWRRPLSNRRH